MGGWVGGWRVMGGQWRVGGHSYVAALGGAAVAFLEGGGNSSCRSGGSWPLASAPVPSLPPWPQAAFKALGQLIHRVGLLLVAHCDRYCAAKAGYPPRLAEVLRQSPCHKGGCGWWAGTRADWWAGDGVMGR